MMSQNDTASSVTAASSSSRSRLTRAVVSLPLAEVPPPPSYKQVSKLGVNSRSSSPPPPTYDQTAIELNSNNRRDQITLNTTSRSGRVLTTYSDLVARSQQHRMQSASFKGVLEAQLKLNYPINFTLVYCTLLAIELTAVFILELLLLLKNGYVIFPLGITYSILSVSVIFSFIITMYIMTLIYNLFLAVISALIAMLNGLSLGKYKDCTTCDQSMKSVNITLIVISIIMALISLLFTVIVYILVKKTRINPQTS